MRLDYLLYDDDPGVLCVTSDSFAQTLTQEQMDPRSFEYRSAVEAGQFFVLDKDEESSFVVRVVLDEAMSVDEDGSWKNRFAAFVTVPCGRLILSSRWSPYALVPGSN